MEHTSELGQHVRYLYVHVTRIKNESGSGSKSSLWYFTGADYEHAIFTGPHKIYIVIVEEAFWLPGFCVSSL